MLNKNIGFCGESIFSAEVSKIPPWKQRTFKIIPRVTTLWPQPWSRACSDVLDKVLKLVIQGLLALTCEAPKITVPCPHWTSSYMCISVCKRYFSLLMWNSHWNIHPWFCLSYCKSWALQKLEGRQQPPPQRLLHLGVLHTVWAFIWYHWFSFQSTSYYNIFLWVQEIDLKLPRGTHSKHRAYSRHKIAVITSGGGKGHERNNSISPGHGAAPALHTGL